MTSPGPYRIRDFLAQALALLLLAGMLMGLFVVLVMPFELVKKQAAESWPARNWRITDSSVARQQGGKGVSYRAAICGVYTDSGEALCASRIRYGGFTFGDGRRQAREIVARYPEGRVVPLHHDPDDPRDTVLEARSPWTEMLVLLGLALAFLLTPLLLWAWRRR
jgi:hypothetical protein